MRHGACPLLDPCELGAQAFPAGFQLGNHHPLARPAPVEGEAQELEGSLGLTLSGRLFREGHESRLLVIEAQTIFGEPLPECPQDALRVSRILATDDGIVRIAVEGDLPSTMSFYHRFEPRVDHVMREDIREDRAAYTSYKVANMLVEFSTSIPRTQLRPSYGDGFRGAPLQTGQPLELPPPQGQGDQRGSSSTQSQQNPGSAPHV